MKRRAVYTVGPGRRGYLVRVKSLRYCPARFVTLSLSCRLPRRSVAPPAPSLKSRRVVDPGGTKFDCRASPGCRLLACNSGPYTKTALL